MDYRAITLDDRSLIDKYAGYAEGSCQYSFPAMFCLQAKYGDSIREENGWLYILRSRLGTRQYRTCLFPLGEGDPAEPIVRILGEARKEGRRTRFLTATKRQRDILDSLYPGRFSACEDRSLAEYLYDRERLAGLSGHQLHTRRKECEQFRLTYGGRAEIRNISPADLPEIREFQAKWMAEHGTGTENSYLQYESESTELALDNFEGLGLRGILIRIDGSVRGYSFGYLMTPDYMDGQHEKCDTSCQGIYSVLKQAFACAAGSAKYINWEEDLGIPGLRQHKLSYRPDILLTKYVISEAASDEQT
ncbi:MAG: phosphatidylglycerol lysyltransferase domain-containing protein [Lachnospiraceae bacterium]|jgi:hypothetical protein|nr:phosphatidylglycerol lysyltransferase domain-containing protein [Lachnospiraceae bacterium]